MRTKDLEGENSYKLRSALLLRAMIVAACVCGVIAALSGCGSSSGDSSPKTASDAAGVAKAKAMAAKYEKPPQKILQTEPLPHTPPKNKLIVFMVQGSVPGQHVEGNGVQAGAKALGWRYDEISYDPSNASTLQSGMMNALATHPAAVAVDGVPTSTYGASVVSAYTKAGVPILVASTAMTPTKTLIGPIAALKWAVLEGQALAYWFVADSSGTGKAILMSVPFFPTLAKGDAAFVATVHQLCPSCSVKLAPLSLPEVGQGTATSAAVNALRSNSDYKYLLWDYGDFSSGINSALASAGLSGVKVAGMYGDVEQNSALRAKQQYAWTSSGACAIGYAIADAAARRVEGVPIGATADPLATQILTPENVGTTTNWNEPKDGLQQYEKLWKVPVRSVGPTGTGGC